MLIPLLAGLVGCDVAVAALLASRSGSGSSSKSSPDTTYRVWVKLIAAGQEVNEVAALQAVHGNPAKVSGWKRIGIATETNEFILPATATFNAICITANSNQAYNIESVALLDVNKNVTEWASGTTYPSNIGPGTEDKLLGRPDGVATVTAATATDEAFIFTLWALTDSPKTVRVNAWGVAPTSGDIDLRQIQARPGIQKVGGAALRADGKLYGMAKDDFGVRAVILFIYPAGGGTPTTNAAIESNPVTTDQGNNTVVIDQSTSPNSVYVGTTYSDPASAGSGRIHVMKLEGPGSIWTQTLGSQGVCRIEAHGLALDNVGDVVVAGGLDWGVALGGLGPIVRKMSHIDGSQLWVTPPGRLEGNLGPFDLNGDYYLGAAAESGDIWTTGSLQKTPPAGAVEIYSERRDGSTSGNGALKWSDYADGASPDQTALDRGNAVVVDGQKNAYVGGFYTATGPEKRGIIVVYPDPGTPPTFSTFFVETINAPSEVLGLAVDTVGGQTFIYATGYETVTPDGGPRKHLFVAKFTSTGTMLWKRTYNGGVGDDRGVSLALDSTNLWVWGETTVAASDVDAFYLRMVK